MNNDIPEGWQIYSLKDIALKSDKYSLTGGPFGSNLKSEDYTESGVRIIQLQNIGDGEFKNTYKIYTSPEKADELSSCNIFPSDIILSKMGDPVARATIIPAFDKRYLMASDGIRLVVDRSRFNTKFIHDSINSISFRAQAEMNSTGSTRKRIGLTELRNLVLIAPPLPEQQKIATILTSVDTVIEKTRAQINKLKDLKTGMMQELLTKGIGHTEFKDSPVGRIPKAWKVMPLGSICDLEVGYAFKSSWFSESGVRLLRGDNVGYGQPTWERIHYLPEEQSKTYSKYLLVAGDIIIGMDRTFTKSGVKVTKLRVSDAPALLVQRVGKFLPKKCTKEFLWQLVRSPNFTKALKNQEKGMDIPHLSKTEILEPTVAVPSLGEQADIAKTLDSQDVVLDRKQKKLAHLEQIKKALMQDLLTGEIRV